MPKMEKMISNGNFTNLILFVNNRAKRFYKVFTIEILTKLERSCIVYYRISTQALRVLISKNVQISHGKQVMLWQI